MKILSLLLSLLLACHLTGALAKTKPLKDRPDMKKFIQEMVKKHHFDKKHLTNLFKDVKLLPKVIRLMDHPHESSPWHLYRRTLVTHSRVREGVRYWRDHAHALAKAEKKYGVPADIITAIVGIESNYGRLTGSFPTLDTLSTLAFAYPSRARFFRSELAQYLLLTQELKLDPRTVKGSYAGALGLPQFMPSSYRHYAVDFSSDNKKDLLHDTVDVIGSVANYLKLAGWEKGKQVAVKAKVTGKAYRSIANKGLKPKYTTKQLSLYKVKSEETLPKGTRVTLLKFSKKKGNEFWLGLNNFYAITRYNTSSLYAMAVYQLGEKIKTLKHKQDKIRNLRFEAFP